MPSVTEAINTDRSNLTPIEAQPAGENKPPVAQDSRVGSLLRNPYQRCPLPPSNNSADSLRQWGQGSDVPRFRTQTPPTNVGGTGGTTVVHVGQQVVNGGSGTPGTSSLPLAQNASITTPVLAPSQTWTGTVQMAKSFTVLSVSGSSFARIELYGTKIAQTLDISRPVSQAPLNTTQGLIMDVVLLTALTWKVLDCVGSNADSPQTQTIYITVTNVSTAAQAFVISLQFVPSES